MQNNDTNHLTVLLKVFCKLYNQRKDHLKRISDRQEATRVNNSEHVVVPSRMTLFLVKHYTLWGIVAGVLGGMLGWILGTCFAALVYIFNEDAESLNKIGSFFCGVFGSALGGAFSGTILALFCLAQAGENEHRFTVWCLILFYACPVTTGYTVGRLAGWVGGIVGFIGGLCGALVLEFITYFSGGRRNTFSQLIRGILWPPERDLNECLSPLVEQLKTIKRLCDRMASKDIISVATQVISTLAAVTLMQRRMNNSTEAANMSQVLQELEKMKEEAEQFALYQINRVNHPQLVYKN